jgi:hypothetical protein
MTKHSVYNFFHLLSLLLLHLSQNLGKKGKIELLGAGKIVHESEIK